MRTTRWIYGKMNRYAYYPHLKESKTVSEVIKPPYKKNNKRGRR